MDEKECGIEELESLFTNESSEPIRIAYSAIESVTKNFYQEIGRGGFGTVYLGSLGNNVMVAVKKLDTSRDVSDNKFLGEVKCLKTVNHKNIVRFLGYCAYTHGVVMEMGGEVIMAEEPKRFLCFEYAPNGSLHDYLKVSSAGKTHAHGWNICYKIIKGICQGLHYLHQKGIKHMDLKPENVLLGAQMEPKITDFGLSRNDGTQCTIVTENAMGTRGYMPPELIDEGKISFKSDIYSLGIIMIRLLTGNNEDIPENWHESLTIDCQQKERCIEIAQICSDNDPYRRPTISDIISKLTETETTYLKAPPVITIEPRNDPTSTLYKNVKIFLAQHYRGVEKLPAERPKWKLAFQVPPKLPIITGENIRDANGNPLEVILVDTDTGEPSWAPPDVLQIELVLLLGNFPLDSWNADDFQRGVVEDLEGRHPVLVGEYSRPTMWDGRACVNELMFTDAPQYCGCMFRIGVRVVPDSYHGARILEGTTEAFMVRNRHDYELHRSKNYKWQLAFQSQPQHLIYVGRQIRDVIGNPLEVILVDAETGLPSTLPMMELHIELVSLFPPYSHEEDCSAEEFQKAVCTRRDFEPHLSGDISLTMKGDGRVTVNELQYTGSLEALKMNHFGHIGVCVVPGKYNGPGRIREGITHHFEIRDEEMVTKRFAPGLGDDVWKLEGISWGGVFHKRLEQNNVRNVQHFLTMLAVKPDELRAIAGDGMDDSRWSEIISHARACIFPLNKVYAYNTAHSTIYVNSIFDLVKVELGGVECPLQQLDEAQKRLVQQAMQEAYEHRHNLQELNLTLKLAFKSQPRLPIYTGSRIEDATGNPLEIILVDAETGSPWMLPMNLTIELVPLSGDFPPYDGKDWSVEEFRKAIVKPRQKDVPLLISYGNNLIMSDGHVTVPNELQFMDDSYWIRCRKFRIGAQVRPGANYDGSFRILEAMTEAFVVGDLSRKHYPPVLSDPIWRLEMIDKDGESHRKLMSKNIDTVQEFLRMLFVKPLELRAIVGDAMTDRMWDKTKSHARHCDHGDKMYAYSGENSNIYVDSIFRRLLKIEIDGVECLLDGLDDYVTDEALVLKTRIARQVILEAYEHRHNLQEVDAAKELHNKHVCFIESLLSETSEHNRKGRWLLLEVELLFWTHSTCLSGNSRPNMIQCSCHAWR